MAISGIFNTFQLNENSDSESDSEFFSDVLESLPRLRFVPARPNFFDEMCDIEFFRRFRFSKEGVLKILQLVEDQLTTKTRRNRAHSPMNRLLIALRFYATGSFQMVYGDLFKTHRTTAGRILREVTAALVSLNSRFITMPQTDEELQSSMCKFYNFVRPNGIPGVIGLIDGTHVKIISPPGTEIPEVFRNRKGYFSINVQAVCDSEMRFIDIVARWPGSQHDSMIFNESKLKARFVRGDFKNAKLLGDAGYPNDNFILTPLRNPGSDAEKKYNDSHILTRNLIERAFGVAKRRFPALSVGLQINLSLTLEVIVACFMLHNLAIEFKESTIAFEPPENQDPLTNMDNSGILEDRIERNLIIQNFFS